MKQRKTAIVTGAGRGIGRGIALALADSGFNVAGIDIVYNPEDMSKGLAEVQAAVERRGVSFLPLQADISVLDDHERVLESVVDEFCGIDLLVNNAGVAPEKRLDILEMTPESYDRVMDINARGTVFFTQAAANIMISKGFKGFIVFITSVSAAISSPSRAEYCISKAALSHAARIFADRLAEHSINVYEIRPGIVKTDMTKAVAKKYDRLIAGGLIPQKRWGTPEDVGKAVAAIAGGAFSYSTGIIFEISGGMNIVSL